MNVINHEITAGDEHNRLGLTVFQQGLGTQNCCKTYARPRPLISVSVWRIVDLGLAVQTGVLVLLED